MTKTADKREIRRLRAEIDTLRTAGNVNVALVQSAQKEIASLTRSLAEAMLLIDTILSSWTREDIEQIARLRKLALL